MRLAGVDERAHHRRRRPVGALPARGRPRCRGWSATRSTSGPTSSCAGCSGSTWRSAQRRPERSGRRRTASCRLVGAALLAHFDVADVRHHRRPRRRPRTSHRRLPERQRPPAMIPTFRPDAAHRLLGDPPAWNAWVDRLGPPTATRSRPRLAARRAHGRLARFAALGGRASDHGLAYLPDRPPRPGARPTRPSAARAPAAAPRPTSGTRCCSRSSRSPPGSPSPTTPCCSSTSARAATCRRGCCDAGRARCRRRRHRRRPAGARAGPLPRRSRAGTARCPAPSSTTPTRPTTPSSPPSPAPSRGPGSRRSCSGGRRGGSTTTSDGMRRQLDDLVADRPARRVHRHAHRLALDPVDDPPRAVPAHPLRLRSAATSRPA